MLKLISLNVILYLSVIILVLLFIHISNKGLLGLRLQKFCNSNSKIEKFLLFLMIFSILMFLIELLFVYNKIFKPEYLHVIENNSTQDPVRWWPSGTPQSWGIIGAAVAVYRAVPGSPRVKAMAGLRCLGVSIPSAIWFHAVENPNGFNRLKYSWVEYKKNGSWPANVPNEIKDSELNPVLEKLIEEGKQLNESFKGDSSSSVSSSFLGDGNILDKISWDSFYNNILHFFRPQAVEGYLDDLIGLELFIHFLLLILVISVIILFIIYIIINFMLQNKEFILNRFENKFIKFYLKYQFFLGKISVIVLPVLILFGLIQIFVGLFYIVTHPLPLEELNSNLHIYIKKK